MATKKLIVLVFLLFFACTTKKNTPEGVLSSFIDARFDEMSNENLLEMLTGEIKSEFESTDEQDLAALSLKDYQRNKFRVLSNRCDGVKCFITYELSLYKKDDNKTTVEIKTKKMAEVVNEDGEWKIAKINQIKTFHENKDPIEPLKK